ncbi:uncharacterized protein LOC141902351 [Tubulanus polymorphus]|uniref:uncharacterized protein LOC141902351 n=1 Tax=Tubulanus polymorphus TaxID=672921 RepID=UPI003DA6B648
MSSSVVKVYIYDISRGMARAMSLSLLGKQLDGIWHTGIVVYGQEYFFGGGGIENCRPGGTIMGQPDNVVELGPTEIPKDIFIHYLSELAHSTFRPEKYHLFDHNCNTFSSEIAKFLTGNDIPSYITSLPQEVLNTSFGAMLRPMIDAMSVTPEGGNQMFPDLNQPETGAVSNSQSATAATAAVTHSVNDGRLTDVSGFKVFKQSNLEAEFSSVKSTLVEKLSIQEFGLVESSYHCLTHPGSNIMSIDHLKTIGKLLIRKQELETVENGGRCLSFLLSTAHQSVLDDMMQAFIITDPDRTVMKMIGTIALSTAEIKTGLAKLLLNCSASPICCSWMLDGSQWSLTPSLKMSCQKVTLSTISVCLKGTDDEQLFGAAAAVNIIKHSIPEDACDFTSGLVKCLLEAAPKLSDSFAVKLCLVALNTLPDQKLKSGSDATRESRPIVVKSTTDPEIEKLCAELNKKLTTNQH